MSYVGQLERATQDEVVTLFQSELGYEYLGDWQDRDNNRNVEEALLRTNLEVRGYSDSFIIKAIQKFTDIAGDQSKNLYEVNKAVYNALRYGVKVNPGIGEPIQTVWLIDWEQIDNNHFAIAEEVTFKGQHTKRPDIVLYVNGIALGIIELKRSKVDVSHGIRQNLDNQKPIFIKDFFTTMQLVMAGNDTQGLRYGTTQTPQRYYLEWKEANVQDNPDNRLHDDLVHLCNQERFLEIIRDFVVFDSGVKKLCRPNQYFGVKAAQERIRQREGGIIWHTQGSGKSLTMVWLTKWIREQYSDARVLVITDRTELDEQIERIYLGVNENIKRTKSSRELIAWLADSRPLLMCSLIHKFPGKDDDDNGRAVVQFLEELDAVIPPDFKPHGDFYVFVDECHRTQSGLLHRGMKALLPNALFIGFTGTPLLRTDKLKKTSIETFGTYIHTYRYNEAVADGVVLDLRYEARDIDQHLSSQHKIDQWFESKTRVLTDYQKAQLKRRWGTMQQVRSAQRRLERIVDDIIFDMEIQPRLAGHRGNAILVSNSIYEACKFYELFVQKDFDKCAIITSYKPSEYHIKGEETGEGETENIEKHKIYQDMLQGQSPEDFESAVKKKFIEEPGRMKLLIVVDKLLTGFDAPSATYLYIDKQMRDHGLFQAICRVNRLDNKDEGDENDPTLKEYGYIIDYKDLFQNLQSSILDYTSGAFEEFDKEDVAGLLSNRIEKARERLEVAREQVIALCESVDQPKTTQDYIRYFCGDPSNKDELKKTERQRHRLYTYVVALIRAFANFATDMPDAGYTVEEIKQIKEDVEYFDNIRQEIKLASGDYIDLKMYEPGMRQLLDRFIEADESRQVSELENFTLVELIVKEGEAALEGLPENIRNDQGAVAETIENNVRRVIIEETPVNPIYYDKMSTLLDTLIEQRRAEAIEYEEYMQRIVDLIKNIKEPERGATYPKSMNSRAKQAIYDSLTARGTNEPEKMTLVLDEVINTSKKHGWRNDQTKEREIQKAIYNQVGDVELTHRIFQLVKHQTEY